MDNVIRMSSSCTGCSSNDYWWWWRRCH